MHSKFIRKYISGFGLVEIMVAMVIGMFGVLIMMQVLSVSEEQKRTTTGGNDAMNEGVMALYALQGDIRMAGFDFSDIALLGCNFQLRTAPSNVTLSALAPVVINSPDIPVALIDANTDSILVSYGNGSGTPGGDVVLAVGNNMQTPAIFAVGDWVVLSPQVRPLPCNLVLDKVTDVNLGTSAVTLASGAVMTKGDRLFNLGRSFRSVGYAVIKGNLTSCEFTDPAKDCTKAGGWASISSNIVSLKAQYGRDTTAPKMDGYVDIYDTTTPKTPATLACDWSRISALRLALVARSQQYEKDPVTGVTTPAPTWDGQIAGNPVGSAANPIDVSGNPVDPMWQNYRYKTFQTIVPIRNIAWMGIPTLFLTATPAC
jgi:type IV pilus assembly protein PilW